MGSILGQIEFYFDFLLILKRYFKKVIFSYVLLGYVVVCFFSKLFFAILIVK